jgi:hypothetical protein
MLESSGGDVSRIAAPGLLLDHERTVWVFFGVHDAQVGQNNSYVAAVFRGGFVVHGQKLDATSPSDGATAANTGA